MQKTRNSTHKLFRCTPSKKPSLLSCTTTEAGRTFSWSLLTMPSQITQPRWKCFQSKFRSINLGVSRLWLWLLLWCACVYASRRYHVTPFDVPSLSPPTLHPHLPPPPSLLPLYLTHPLPLFRQQRCPLIPHFPLAFHNLIPSQSTLLLPLTTSHSLHLLIHLIVNLLFYIILLLL